MPLKYGNNSIGGVVYVDENKAQRSVKEVYFGQTLVYEDGTPYIVVVNSKTDNIRITINDKKTDVAVQSNVPCKVRVQDKITTARSMFSSCYELVSVDLSRVDMSGASSETDMFWNCMSLTSVDLGNFVPKVLASTSDMFYNCKKLTHIKCTQAFMTGV